MKLSIESADQDVTISIAILFRDKTVRLVVEYAFIHHDVEVFASELKVDQDLTINVGLDYGD